MYTMGEVAGIHFKPRDGMLHIEIPKKRRDEMKRISRVLATAAAFGLIASTASLQQTSAQANCMACAYACTQQQGEYWCEEECDMSQWNACFPDEYEFCEDYIPWGRTVIFRCTQLG